MSTEWGDTYLKLTHGLQNPRWLNKPRDRELTAEEKKLAEESEYRRPFSGNPMTREEYRRVHGV